MVDEIEICIKNGVLREKNILIIPKEDKMYVNNEQYPINKEIISKLLNILATWKYEYGKNNEIDAEEFKVVVKSKDGATVYHGKGIFPNNYNEFLEVLGGIQNGE